MQDRVARVGDPLSHVAPINRLLAACNNGTITLENWDVKYVNQTMFACRLRYMGDTDVHSTGTATLAFSSSTQCRAQVCSACRSSQGRRDHVHTFEGDKVEQKMRSTNFRSRTWGAQLQVWQAFDSEVGDFGYLPPAAHPG